MLLLSFLSQSSILSASGLYVGSFVAFYKNFEKSTDPLLNAVPEDSLIL